MKNPTFKTQLTVRIGDINYGKHLAHDKLITLLHQARIEFLSTLGGSETNLYGVGLIMRALSVDYLGEAFLNDRLNVYVRLEDVRRVRFSLYYSLDCAQRPIARAMTEMVAFDYNTRKVVALPKAFLSVLEVNDG